MPETLFLTMNVIDRFLEQKAMTRKNLQLVSNSHSCKHGALCSAARFGMNSLLFCAWSPVMLLPVLLLQLQLYLVSV